MQENQHQPTVATPAQPDDGVVVLASLRQKDKGCVGEHEARNFEFISRERIHFLIEDLVELGILMGSDPELGEFDGLDEEVFLFVRVGEGGEGLEFDVGVVAEVAEEEGEEDGDDEFGDEMVGEGLYKWKNTPKMEPLAAIGRVSMIMS